MVVEIKHRFTLRPVGFRFDAQSVFFLCQQWDVDLGTIDNIPPGEYVDSWVWCAHRSYCLPRLWKPISYPKMRQYIANLKKSEWDMILKAMTESRSQGEGDKKKVEAGEISSSLDGRQE